MCYPGDPGHDSQRRCGRIAAHFGRELKLELGNLEEQRPSKVHVPTGELVRRTVLIRRVLVKVAVVRRPRQLVGTFSKTKETDSKL